MGSKLGYLNWSENFNHWPIFKPKIFKLKVIIKNSIMLAWIFQVAEDKNQHLAKMKAKLESTLDEVEDALEREKKARLDQERNKRQGHLLSRSDILQNSDQRNKGLTISPVHNVGSFWGWVLSGGGVRCGDLSTSWPPMANSQIPWLPRIAGSTHVI